MNTKHFVVKCAVLGIFLSLSIAGTASAQQYFIEVTSYCHATQTVSDTCTVDSPVTIMPKAQGGTGNETFDFDPDGDSFNFHPEVFNASQATFTYNKPSTPNVVIRATDGSSSIRGYSLQITDPDGTPDPNAGPAFRLRQSTVRALKDGSSCLVNGRIGYESYRSSAPLVKIVVQKRLRRISARTSRKWTRFTSLSRRSTRDPSYDVHFLDVFKRLNPNGSRLRRLARKYTFRLVVRQTVTVEGTTRFTARLIKPFQPRACRISR